jgi:REP element-mobilizing transposase RayT
MSTAIRGAGHVRPGGIYHVISRFNGKEWFIESSLERQIYELLLGQYIARTDCRLLSWALMSSHVHLAFLAGYDPVADWLRPLHGDFATWLNDRRGRIGGVFVKGPNTVEVQCERVADVINYIHCNPVRARVVTHASDSDWTSHRAYLGRGRVPRWLDVDVGLALARMESGAALDAWIESTRVGRREVETAYVTIPDRRGRPRALNENTQLAVAA